MNQLYNTKDIQTFLLSHNIVWNGQCVHETHTAYGDEILANMLFNNENESIQVTLSISPTSFFIYEETCEAYYDDTDTSINEIASFANEWMLFLINKSTENAKIIKQKATDKLNRIASKCDSELRGIEAQKKLTIARYNNMSSPWNDIIEAADETINKRITNNQQEPENE